MLKRLENGSSGEITSDENNDEKKSNKSSKDVLHSGMKLIGIGDDSLLLSNTPDENNGDNEVGQIKCLPLRGKRDPLPIDKDKVDPVIFTDAVLEHPAIPGLMLSLEERLYGGYLEYIDGNGKQQEETVKQRPFRRKWKKPIPMSVSPSDYRFINLNPALFPGKKKTD